jgi:hypothetical protein
VKRTRARGQGIKLGIHEPHWAVQLLVDDGYKRSPKWSNGAGTALKPFSILLYSDSFLLYAYYSFLNMSTL